jgi:signal transduction histidine kinase/sensor domain CHASE-containing protein
MKFFSSQRAAGSAPSLQPPLRVWLVVVMLVAAVPLALLMAWQLFGDMQEQQRRLDENLQRTAAALAASVERELATQVDVLTQLAQRLQRTGADTLPALQSAVREHTVPSPWQAIYLRGAEGQVRWHSAGRAPVLPLLAGATVSDLVQDQGHRGTLVEVPLTTSDGQRHALGGWVDAAHWQRLVESGGAPGAGWLRIVGRDRRLIARSGASSAARLDAGDSGDTADAAAGSAVRRIALPDGAFAYSAQQTAPLSGWTASARMAAAPIDSAQRRALLMALTTITACLLLGVALATLLARHVAEPLTALATQGPAALAAPPRVREIAQLRDALASAQDQEALSRVHLQRKADEFQALFAGTPVGLTYLPDTPSGRVLHNAAMDALLGPQTGAPPVQMFERGRALAPEDEPLQRAVRSGREVGPIELELRAGDRPRRYVLARAVPLQERDGRTRGAVAAMVEITERKQAEQRLLETDERLRHSQGLIELVQDAGDVGFFQHRIDSAASSWTPGQARLWGYDPAQAPPTPAELLARVHADDRPALLARWRALIDNGAERGTVEYRITRGNDAPRWLSTRVMLAYADACRPSQVVGVTLDISEHKRTESERAVLIAGEQAARQQAEAASRAKDEFLAMLGHELRNPLGAIASAVAVLDRVDAGTDTAANARLIIGRQTRHLAHLMDDLLDVGRVISGKVLLSTRRVELGELVERVLADFELTGASRQHDVQRALEPVWVEVDPTRIEQVVGNLLGNAFKYTPPGRRIEVVSCRREGRALLEVRDQGPGIDAALLPRIFDLFVQGDRTLDRPGGGLGIGLTLVRRLVELHGGHVSARSSEQGTTFQVVLPAVQAPAHAEQALSRPRPQPRRVLLVDDNADVLAALRSMLELDGHVVSTAADGERGLALLLDELPDAAIVDIGLPGLSGYEVAQRSRRAGYAGKLFALSGYGGTQDVAQARRHGFDAHLAKPVDPQRLQELVAST